MSAKTGRALDLLWLAPALGLIALTALFPIAATLWISLHRRFPIFGIDEFIGLGNYLQLARNPRLLHSAAVTLYFTVLTVSIEFLLGLGCALALWRDFRGHRWVLGGLLAPWIVPTAVSARVWEWIFNAKFGILNHLLLSAGLIAAPETWLGSPRLAIHAAALAEIWKTTPFMALLLLAGLRTMPENLLRAAAVDGAGPWTAFRHVVWPHLRPMAVIAVLFRSLDALRVFDVLFVLTGGGPAGTTETLSILAFKQLFQTLNFGYGSAVGFSILLLACLPTGLALAILGRSRRAR